MQQGDDRASARGPRPRLERGDDVKRHSRVEAGGDLVHAEHPGVGDERLGDGDALLLPAGHPPDQVVAHDGVDASLEREEVRHRLELASVERLVGGRRRRVVVDEFGRLADVDEGQVGVHLLDVRGEPGDVDAAFVQLLRGESVVGDARAVDLADLARAQLMRESLEQRRLAVAGWGEHEGDLAGAKGAGDVLEHLEVLDRVAGVRLWGRAQGAGDASDRGERRAGEHLGHGDDGSVHLAGGQLEGVGQVALDLNLGQLAVGLGLGLEHGDVIAELVALQRSHGSDWLNLRPSRVLTF